MIEARELRIGNYINYKSDIITITMIGRFGVQSDNNGCIVNAKFSTPDLSGISLSPDIIKKCGFKEKRDWFYLKHFILGFITTEDHFQTEYKISGVEGEWKLLDIKYLHQLQNLYFCLTGKELEIKL